MLLLRWSGLAGAAKREMLLLPRAESPALHYYHYSTTDQPTPTDDNDHDAIAR